MRQGRRVRYEDERNVLYYCSAPLMFSTHTTFLLKYYVVSQCEQDAFSEPMHISQRYDKRM
jgi:hypothetical protein